MYIYCECYLLNSIFISIRYQWRILCQNTQNLFKYVNFIRHTHTNTSTQYCCGEAHIEEFKRPFYTYIFPVFLLTVSKTNRSYKLTMSSSSSSSQAEKADFLSGGKYVATSSSSSSVSKLKSSIRTMLFLWALRFNTEIWWQ